MRLIVTSVLMMLTACDVTRLVTTNVEPDVREFEDAGTGRDAGAADAAVLGSPDAAVLGSPDAAVVGSPDAGPLGSADAGSAGDAGVMTSAWLESAYLKASNTGTIDFFGFSISLSSDGTTLVVGAMEEDSAPGAPNADGLTMSGAAYVFRRVAGSWVQEAFLKASNAGAEDLFGVAVALDAAGDTLVVGAQWEDGQGDLKDDVGAAYVFERVGTQWTEVAILRSPMASENSFFGSSVAINGPGDTIAVGAPNYDRPSPVMGAVFLFAFNGGWNEQAFVQPPSTRAFGSSVALSADGNTLAVGAPEADAVAPFCGAAWTYARTGAAWGAQQQLTLVNAAGRDRFGLSVSLSGDGTLLAIGAPGRDDDRGSVYVFEAPSQLPWVLLEVVDPTVRGPGDEFGASVALSGDGTRLLVGAWGEGSSSRGLAGDPYDNLAPYSGAATLFHRGVSGWAPHLWMKSSNADPQDGFGWSVSLDETGTTIAVSATAEASAATGVNGDRWDNSAERGAVYVFVEQ